jgi:hypothetical protein
MAERTLSRHRPSFSPLEPIFAPHAGAVPFALREQFYVSPDDGFDVVLKGKMHRVWYRPGWLRPLMWVLGKCGILVPEKGRNIHTMLRVIARRDRSGRPIHTWARTFYFPKRLLRFNTSIVYDSSLDHTADLVGPNNVFFIMWRAQFRPPVTFTLDTARGALRVGKRRIWIPDLIQRWALGVVHHSQWVDRDRDDTIHIELMLWHPLVGYFFGYEGTFRLTREAHGTRVSNEAPQEWTHDMAECTM